jgi:thioredoxin
LLTGRWCSICPSAKSFWRELKDSNEFEYEEVDAESERGSELIERYSITTVPTSIIDGRVLFRGVPIHEQVEKLFKPSRRMLESRQ